jgi:hypothetical protein
LAVVYVEIFISDCVLILSQTKTGCFVSHTTDKILFPGEYETAEEYHRKRLEAVVVLQTHVRRWLAERYVNILRKEKVEHERWMKEEEASRQKEREERIKREFDRRMNPKTKEDFEVLYHALEMWRIDELTKINETTSGPERKAALCGLLEQEAQLIASIGQHKILANQENKVASTRKLLDNMAAPRRWIAFDGRATEMDTPYSLRAHQLKEMYLSLTSSDLDVEERKDLLMSVRATVSEHDCKLTRDIVDLVDREADFLDRHMPVSTMDGLRKRISTLFLQYVKTPHFNAAAASHIKVRGCGMFTSLFYRYGPLLWLVLTSALLQHTPDTPLIHRHTTKYSSKHPLHLTIPTPPTPYFTTPPPPGSSGPISTPFQDLLLSKLLFVPA